MLLYASELLSSICDQFGLVSFIRPESLALCRVIWHRPGSNKTFCRVVTGRLGGLLVALPTVLETKGAYLLVRLPHIPELADDLPSDLADLERAIPGELPRVRISLDFNGFHQSEACRLTSCMYGRNLMHIQRHHAILLCEAYERVKDKYALQLYTSDLEFRRKDARLKYGLDRCPYYDEFCPSGFTAWRITLARFGGLMNAPPDVMKDVGEFVSYGRHRQPVPIVPITSSEISIPPSVVGLPAECVSESYLCPGL